MCNASEVALAAQYISDAARCTPQACDEHICTSQMRMLDVRGSDMLAFRILAFTSFCMQVDCSSAKASILQQATSLRQALQRQIATAWTDSNKAVSVRLRPHVVALICLSASAGQYQTSCTQLQHVNSKPLFLEGSCSSIIPMHVQLLLHISYCKLGDRGDDV